MLDVRCPSYSFSVPVIDHNVGARSLLHRHGYLIVGTGAGRIMFFDVRMNKYLEEPLHEQPGVHHLKSSSGWIGRNPFYQNEVENAIYTLRYNDDKNLLFAGGGPIRANIQGSYAGLWRI